MIHDFGARGVPALAQDRCRAEVKQPLGPPFRELLELGHVGSDQRRDRREVFAVGADERCAAVHATCRRREHGVNHDGDAADEVAQRSPDLRGEHSCADIAHLDRRDRSVCEDDFELSTPDRDRNRLGALEASRALDRGRKRDRQRRDAVQRGDRRVDRDASSAARVKPAEQENPPHRSRSSLRARTVVVESSQRTTRPRRRVAGSIVIVTEGGRARAGDAHRL